MLRNVEWEALLAVLQSHPMAIAVTQLPHRLRLWSRLQVDTLDGELNPESVCQTVC